MGQGTQALRLARAGHSVTGLESDAEMLRVARESLGGEPAGIRERVRLIEGNGLDTGVHFLPGSFDVVLCHGVLMYVREPDAMVAGLARMLAPGGLLSLLVRNADALAMRPGTAGDWDATSAAFDTDTYTNRLGLTVRADRLDALTATLAGIAAPLHAWYGVRVFTDDVSNDVELLRPPPNWNDCWPQRTGPGGLIRTAGWPPCCICAGCGARRVLKILAGAVRRLTRSAASSGPPDAAKATIRTWMHSTPQPHTPAAAASDRGFLCGRPGERLFGRDPRFAQDRLHRVALHRPGRG